MSDQQTFNYIKENFLPNLSIDIVIIGYQQDTLKCLLLKVGDKWVLPGGFVGITEAVDDAAKRILQERTGLQKPHLKFLSVFGGKDREFKSQIKQFCSFIGMEWTEDLWINQRFVTLSHYSLVDINDVDPKVGSFDDQLAWISIDELPNMWMDHEAIVKTARAALKKDILQSNLTYNLLPTQFTMPELHQLHQTILDKKLDRSRFQKKMLATQLFERLPELANELRGRNPYQYRVREE